MTSHPRLRLNLPGAVRCFGLMLWVFALGCWAPEAGAQPLSVTHWTVEAKVATSERVVVGVFSRVSSTAVGRERTLYRLQVRVQEVMKGEPQAQDVRLQTVANSYPDLRFEQWRRAGTRLLFFIGPEPPEGEARAWECRSLDQPVPAEKLFAARPTLFSLDFTTLEEPAALLARARAFAQEHPRAALVETVHIPNFLSRMAAWDGSRDSLVAPVVPSVESKAKKLITEPQVLVPGAATADPYSRWQLRMAGLNLLRHFRSKANARLLRSLLQDLDAGGDAGAAVGPPVRARAFEILLGWRQPSPPPVRAEQITRLDLSGSEVSDAELPRLAVLGHLVDLNLQETRVTAKGVHHLARLPRLQKLRLSASRLTDGMLRELRRLGLLHRISQVDQNEVSKPQSPAEVIDLTLWHAPITDAGLKELADFKNLTHLDLRNTRVTNTGLKYLATFQHLTTLHLNDTRVTPAGVARLQQALPRCLITQGAERSGK